MFEILEHLPYAWNLQSSDSFTIFGLGLNEIYVWLLLPTYPNFFNPTLNIKMVFGEKIPEMGTFSIFSLFSLLNVIIKFNNFPTYLP